jgi:hypothetical protein
MPTDQHVPAVLEKCLEDLENRIDPETEDGLLQEWTDFSAGRFSGDIFSPKRATRSAPGVAWPEVSVNQALDSFDCMALQQYGQCARALAEGSGSLLAVRCNYGTGILPSLFGMEIFVMEEAYNTLPTSRPLNDLDAVRHIIAAGVPDLHRGYGEQVFEMAERYLKIARRYPKIGRYIHLYHPDTQGPLDVCELIWGSSIFYALYDHPGLVKDLLELVTETYRRFLHAWTALVPFRPQGNVHWGLFHMGNLMLRDDSAMNLSAEMFREFIRPYDQRLLAEFGGGAIHFCGKGDHFIGELARMPGVFAVNLTQPEYNNMETIFRCTVDRGIALLDLKRAAAEAALAAGRELYGRVHAW